MAQPWEVEGPVKAIFEAAERRWLENWRRGPTHQSWTELPPQKGDPAPRVELLTTDGQVVPIESAWADRPALLLFWRHWGCGCGVGRAEQLREEYPRLVEAGGNVLVIGQGEPERAAWYREAFEIPAPILVDPNGDAYRAFGLLDMSPWILLGEPKPDMSVLESWIPEHRAKGRPVADNPFLLPGEFVIDTAGELVLIYRYQHCDNYPDLDTLLGGLHEAQAG